MVRFRVKELAQAQGLTSEDLSHRSGVKISTIRNLYQNAVEDPGYRTLAAVAKALGVRIEELIVDDGTGAGPRDTIKGNIRTRDLEPAL